MATTNNADDEFRAFPTDNTTQTKTGVASSYTFDNYQQDTGITAIYPEKGTGNIAAVNYCVLGLIGEAGELANKWKKFFRDDLDEAVIRADLYAELGDVLWYASQLASELEYSLGDIATDNIRKLQKRRRNGKLHGSGDDR